MIDNFKQITLSVKRSVFRRDDPTAEMADTGFKAVRQKVLERDKYKCHFCRFHSEKYQEVHHINDDHSDNKDSNLMTVCCLCHQAHHIGLAGVNNSGILIYVDDMGIGQTELNALTRNLWIGEMSKDKSVKTSSMQMLARLHKLSIEARRVLGTSDPVVLGDYLLNLSEEDYACREEALKGILLLPIRDHFEARINYWAKSVYKSIPPQTWARVAESKIKQISSN